MGFDDASYNTPGYPCECGGSIEPVDIHWNPGWNGDPPDPCCQMWECGSCGATHYEHDSKELRC